jgi:histidine triad (HIT) family protein
MSDCIFCKIVKGDIPAYKVYEDDDFMAFLDIAEFVEGHTLVIPKKHYRFFWDIDNVGEYYECVSKICNHYTKDLGFKFVDTLTFGRMVPHAHVHLVPHNGENTEWQNSLERVFAMQHDEDRRLTKERGERLVKKFALD